MKLTAGRARSFIAAYAAVMMLASLVAIVLPSFLQPANANHGNRTLDVTPEYQEKFTDEQATLTATLSAAADSESINIDFELEGGPNDNDGTTYGTPDRTCDVLPGQTACSVVITGQASTGSGSDQWRVWIDHDKTQTSTEADLDEGRTASQSDCQQDTSRSNCLTATYTTPPSPTPTPYTPGTGSANCPGGEDPDTGVPIEPDCTDVVAIKWNNRPGSAQTLDCDDTGPPDTERETVPEGGDERYRCVVRNQFGGTMSGQKVYGEVETGTNDPDSPDSASYDSPDYQCQSPSGQTGRDPDVPPGFTADNVCYITVEQVEGELGTAEICFWTGEIADGAALCASEPTGENQQANGSDEGNDLADQVELTWEDTSTFRLDCNPETDSNPAGQAHQVTCTTTSPTSNQAVSGVEVLVEITGAGDPDQTNSPQTPDNGCTTQAGGSCTFSHTSTTTGETTYRAWIEDNDGPPTEIPRNDGTDPDMDRTEGQNEGSAPGEISEPDATDVVTKTWTAAPSTLTMTPESDTASIGECNPYTITLTSGSGSSAAPVPNAIIDVEQRHAGADDNTANNEPTVDFCVPASGPNPSDVDTTKGDLGPGSTQENDRENPDNPGTAGGETEKTTDSNGQVTIGITVAPGQGSDGTGIVTITAFFDSNNNDDPDSSEPKDTSTKQWEDASASDARTIDCEPEQATNPINTDHTVTCTVKTRSGQPVQGEGVTWTEEGPGSFKSQESTTDSKGEAEAVVTSTELGNQTITGTLTDDTGAGEPDNVDECDRPANEPSGAPAGSCSDSVTKTWVGEGARTIDCEPETATTSTEDTHTVTCTVRGDDGQPQQGRSVTFTEDGPGNFTTSASQTTDSNGQASVTVASDQPGTQTITGTLSEANQNEPDTDNCERPANDPTGAPAGTCSDSVTNTWEEQEQFCPGYEGDPRNQVVGTEDDDQLEGTEGDDVICGLGGNDDIDGLGGNDIILGGSGNDSLRGGGGDDEIDGEGDKDEIRGNDGDDVLNGGDQNDVILGNNGNDRMIGGKGFDVLKGGADNDVGKGGSGRDTLQGFTGKDKLAGGGGKDVLKGGRDNDKLNGGGGDDTIAGNAGNDKINGGSGRDTCSGGPGKDRVRNCEKGSARRSGR